jgi:uncharacterized membrane protein YjjB (DUF3815 family)
VLVFHVPERVFPFVIAAAMLGKHVLIVVWALFDFSVQVADLT